MVRVSRQRGRFEEARGLSVRGYLIRVEPHDGVDGLVFGAPSSLSICSCAWKASLSSGRMPAGATWWVGEWV